MNARLAAAPCRTRWASLARLKQRNRLGNRQAYFCQVRFLWRLARNCLRRLCLLIFDLRRFFSDPI